MAYLLHDDSGAVEVFHDRHVMGLFFWAVSLEPIAAAGFEPRAIPFEHRSFSNTGHGVFLGLRPVAGEMHRRQSSSYAYEFFVTRCVPSLDTGGAHNPPSSAP